MWALVIEEDRGKRYTRIYKVTDGQAVHRGKTVPYDELKSRCPYIAENDSPLSMLFHHSVLCLKRPTDLRQTRLLMQRIAFQSKLDSKCLDLETGEIDTLARFLIEGRYTVNDVVGILTKEEYHSIRNFQRRNAR